MERSDNMSKAYEIKFEIEGPAAMFARPDTGVTPVSYPVPTVSAVKGMFDAILRRPQIYVEPIRIEICKPIRYERYVTNYSGPLRSSDKLSGNNNYQLQATILVDVCYRIYGEVNMKQMSTRTRDNGQIQLRRRRGKDWRPKFVDLFNERVNNGKAFYVPCLGWKEFVPTYLGPFRENTKRETGIDEIIPSFLRSMWEHHELKPVYRQDWQIVKGLMSYRDKTPSAEDELYAE